MLRSSLSVKIGVVAVITSAAAWQLHGTVSKKFSPGARSFAVAAACTDPAWSATAVYSGGQRVSHDRKLHESIGGTHAHAGVALRRPGVLA